MARPIPLELPGRDPRQEFVARLQQAPAEHAEALLDAYEFIQQLHEKHIFDVLRGALSAGDKLVETATAAAETPESVRAMRNAIILGKMLGSINSELLECIAMAVDETFSSKPKPSADPPSLLSLLVQFQKPELRRSVAFIYRFLDALGNQLKSGSLKTPQG